ncbi:MAG: hypothetical protein JWN76_2065 [Chitinophagaceae bacterium]|nr:hypothetical protein [Chitinophagaceae bacterium]
MKKLLLLLLICSLGASVSINAQERKDKAKKTSTIPQKVHNTVSKHKKYKGTKVKHKRGHHKTVVSKVNN